MNQIVIMSDEHSYDMMAYFGQDLLTPNLDRLARESQLFRNAYSPCPVCAPARAAFFTGRYVNRLGTWDNATSYDGKVQGMAAYMTDQGRLFYATGKTHFHPDGDYGFTKGSLLGFMGHSDVGALFRSENVERIGAKERYQNIRVREEGESKRDDEVLEEALAYLEELKDQENWTLYVGFLDPHFPFNVKKEYWDYYDERIKQIPAALKPPYTSLNKSLESLRKYFACDFVDEENTRKLLVGYCAAISELDERIGTILDAVDAMGLADKTAILYSSDHGEQSGYHGLWWKCTMFEESAHVPFLLKVPGVVPREYEVPVNLVDIFPTLCGMSDLNLPEGIDGKSLWPLINGDEKRLSKDYTFSEYHAHGMPRGVYMIRWQQYKYILYLGDEEQLFDLEQDPAENYNLLSIDRVSGDSMAVAEVCRRRLYDVCDPLEVDLRARKFQYDYRQKLGIEAYTKAFEDFVDHPVGL